jgi:hypothetical protein
MNVDLDFILALAEEDEGGDGVEGICHSDLDCPKSDKCLAGACAQENEGNGEEKTCPSDKECGKHCCEDNYYCKGGTTIEPACTPCSSNPIMCSGWM